MPGPSQRSRAAGLLLLLAACAGGDESSGSSFGGLSTAGRERPVRRHRRHRRRHDNTDSDITTDTDRRPGRPAATPSTGGDPSSTSGATDDSSDPRPNPNGLPNGEECTDPGQCMTDNCYKIPLPVDGLPPGICSVCDSDMDCVDAGLGTACTVDANSLGRQVQQRRSRLVLRDPGRLPGRPVLHPARRRRRGPAPARLQRV
jgi:hypothetical protein